MKSTNVLLVLALLAPAAYAADPCTGSASQAGAEGQCPETTGNTTSPVLPETAAAKIEKLRIDLRYMRATGHPAEAQKKKDAIAAIYQEHGVPLPEDFTGW